MSGEPDALAVVNQLRDLAADPLNRRTIVQDQGCLPGLILFLDHPDPQVVYSALLAVRHLAECQANREKMRGELGMMLSLQNVMQKAATPGETKLLASEVYELLQACGGTDSGPSEAGASCRRKAHFFLGSSNKRAKTVVLHIAGLDDLNRRDLCEEALLKVRGVISFTFQMALKRCIVRMRSDLKPETLAAAIATTQVMKAQQVVKNEAGQEVTIPFQEDGPVAAVTDLPEYLPEEDSPSLEPDKEACGRGNRGSMLSAAVLLLGLLCAFGLCAICGRKRKCGEPPLITGWIPFLGKALELGRDAHSFLVTLQEKYGDVFTVLVAGKYMTFIMDPLLYPAVVKHGKQLDFHEFSDQISTVAFGYPSIRTPVFPGLSNHIHKSYQLLQGVHLTHLTESMGENLRFVFQQDILRRDKRWSTDLLYRFCSRVMFEASFMTMYGRPAGGERHAQVDVLRQEFEHFDARFPLLVAGVPIWLLRRARAAREHLHRSLFPHRLAKWTSQAQFIQHRINLFDQYNALGEQDKAGHHLAILWASVANTVSATFWAAYHLLTHPEALTVIREELHKVLKESSETVSFGRQQLDSLPCMESAIKESLRLCSASMNIRVAQEDFSLRLSSDRCVAVRQGDIVALYPQSMHMDPEIFEDPERYRCDRFIEDGEEKKRFWKKDQKLTHFLMPFGSGATKCPGRYFAVYEIKQFLSFLLLHFDVEVVEGQRPARMDTTRAGLGLLMPAADVKFRYKRRSL